MTTESVRGKPKKVIYVELTKALYGTLQGALLFWKNLPSFLIMQLRILFRRGSDVAPCPSSMLFSFSNIDADGSKCACRIHPCHCLCFKLFILGIVHIVMKDFGKPDDEVIHLPQYIQLWLEAWIC